MHEIIREGNLPACAYNLKKLMKFVKADVVKRWMVQPLSILPHFWTLFGIVSPLGVF